MLLEDRDLEEKENFKFRIEIGNKDPISFEDMTLIINHLNNFVRSCSLELIKQSDFVKEEDYEAAYKINKPMITAVGNGSIWIDVVIPIACSLIPFAYEVIKDIVHLYNSKHLISDDNKPQVKADIDTKKLKFNWTEKDTLLFTKEAIKVFYTQKRHLSVGNFVCSLPKELQKFGYQSLVCKAKNMKALFEKYNISNTMDFRSLKNYSKNHELVFKQLMGLK